MATLRARCTGRGRGGAAGPGAAGVPAAAGPRAPAAPAAKAKVKAKAAKAGAGAPAFAARRGRVACGASANPALAPRTAEMAGDPFQLLLSQRIVFFGGEVNDFTADAVVSQLLLLDAMDNTKDIKLFINSPGGSVTAGLGVYDAMQLVTCDVQTVCFGLAASMGAFILGAGTPGKRSAMPNARIMIHQPLGGASGAAKDLEIQAKEIMYHKVNINRIMSGYTGKSERQIEMDTDRDRYMSPVEAKEYGIIDTIIGGDEGTFNVAGNMQYFPKSKKDYISWWKEAEEDAGKIGSPFSGLPLEPHAETHSSGKNGN